MPRSAAGQGFSQARCGSVSFVQRFGDALNLNLHFHTMALDGVYMVDEDGAIAFRHVAPPSDAEVARVTDRIRRRVSMLLERRALGPHAGLEEADPLQHDQPLLAELYGASISGRVATGPRAGRRTAKVGDMIDVDVQALPAGPRCTSIAGFSVHANVCVPAHDRMRLERLFRYAGRPPVATDRLSLLPDGRLLYRLKRRWRDGTTHMIFQPPELVERLAALVPPPRFNLVRYHGVLAPSATFRPFIIPELEASSSPVHPGCTANGQGRPAAENSRKHAGCRPRNYSWSQLMRRIFSLDVLECPRCGGRMRILCAIHPPDAIRKILECLGIPSRPPPVASAFPVAEDPYPW